MKYANRRCIFLPWVSLLCALALPLLGAQSQPAAPPLGLEARLDRLMQQMSTQEKIEQLFYKTDGNARLGIPQFEGSDGPHGIGNKAKGWSCFPVTIAMAATWEPELIQRVGKAIALEQASRARHRIAGPTLDLLNDPRNGRAAETIGEDPFLGGRITEGFLRGMNETAVFATIKHYNLNTYESGRETNNFIVDRRSLIEFWGAHWKRAVQDGSALSVMCAYNLINDAKCAENYELIKTILRDHWGFRGYTMSDWGGFADTSLAMNAELDFCEGNELYIKQLPGLVASGKITMAQLDHAVRNVLRTKLLSGMVDGQPKVPTEVRDSPAHRELVYESGLKGLVLLKNQNGILPLDPKIRTVALIGPNAANLPLDGHSSSAVIPSYTITLKEALESSVGSNHVSYARGCDINSTNRSGFADAVAAARDADVVIFAGGLDNTVEGEEYFIKGDRLSDTVELPGMQNELIRAIAAVNPNVVLVVISGGTCTVTPVINQIKGLIYAFYPGQEGGRAIADVLFGRVSPSGKLPVTMPKNDAQLPPRDMDFSNDVVGGSGYRWFDQQQLTPEFAFGAGLSYTEFTYRRLRVSPQRAKLGEEIVVSVDVANVGSRPGAEVVQLYLASDELQPPVAMPVKQLKGFAKVTIAPGKSQRVTFRLTQEELYVFDEKRDRYFVPSGKYRILVGGASDQLSLVGHFELQRAPERPDLQVANLRTIPPFPKPGDAVTFVASVFNRGTGPSPVGSAPQVEFRVNGKIIATAAGETNSIAAGGMILVASSVDKRGKGFWTAAAGKHELQALVDPQRTVTESLERNNQTKATLTLPGGKTELISPSGR
jgi:beta-glucosidase